VGLLETQRSALFERIEERGLQPADCTLTNVGSASVIDHLPTGSRFTINSDDGAIYYGTAKIGSYGPYPYGTMYWDDLLNVFATWAHNVKIEAEAPDLWEELRKGTEFLSQSTVEDVTNSPFTPTELAQITEQIREIKDYLKESRDLSEEQYARIEARLDYAEEACQRLGKKDWIFLFLGTLFSVVGSALLPPDALQHVLSMAAQRIGHLFGGGRPQLPPQA
jgi:hypothetical protein